MKNKYLFVISSAINHFQEDKLSRFTINDRFKQTLETIESIKNKCPESTICLFELSETKLNTTYETSLKSKVDIYLNFSGDDEIQTMYINFSKNLDLFKYGKSLLEIKGFILTLEYLKSNDLLYNITRIFKITGRYLLNNNFNIQEYNSIFLRDKYIANFGNFSRVEPLSNVHYYVYKNEGFITTALWSFGCDLLNETIEIFYKSYDYLSRMLLYTPGNDIEHSVYDFIDKSKLIYCDILGVTVIKGMDEDNYKI